jgi:predicted nucleic acid-binding protein
MPAKARKQQTHASQGLGISDIAFAELAPAFPSAEEAVRRIGKLGAVLLRPSPEALYHAERVYLRYRQNRGSAQMILPDFLIGSHAETESSSLITRDCARYQSYFPSVRLTTP